ncbi:MAG TPA: hypothetical protein VFA20_16900 [Myxococcaceae bacterium]|nr:hypothetical protein [Myxococcaceae bacterium]
MFVLALAGLLIAVCLVTAVQSVLAGAIAGALPWAAGSAGGAGVVFLVLRSGWKA